MAPLFLAKYHNCKIALRNIVHKKRELYSAESKDLLEIAWERRPPPSNWKPKGLLVAHLQEHRAAINRWVFFYEPDLGLNLGYSPN